MAAADSEHELPEFELASVSACNLAGDLDKDRESDNPEVDGSVGSLPDLGTSKPTIM